MSRLTEIIERELAQRAGLYLAVEEDEGTIVLSGIVGNENEREAALDIARELSAPQALVDGIEVLDRLPEEIEAAATLERGTRGLPQLQHATGGVALEPGDFVAQPLLDSAEEASGPEWSLEEDLVSEGDEVYVPATDPTTRGDEVVGGLELTSMDSLEVEASSDGQLGDEAIRDAVLRELREDAATTDLDIEVAVEGGVARLTGRVQSVSDAESAEEVASRVPGVTDVDEALEVTDLER